MLTDRLKKGGQVIFAGTPTGRDFTYMQRYTVAKIELYMGSNPVICKSNAWSVVFEHTSSTNIVVDCGEFLRYFDNRNKYGQKDFILWDSLSTADQTMFVLKGELDLNDIKN